MKKAKDLDRAPHNLRRKRLKDGRYDSAYPEAWYYNDPDGLYVVVAGNIARIPWRVIELAAQRVGRQLRRQASQSEGR